MRRLSLVTRALIALVLVAGYALVLATPTQAVTKYARVTFHVAECPANTGDLFGKCHENRVADFGIWGCSPTGWCLKLKFTDSNGVVSFGPRAGYNRFFVDDLGDYVGTYIYCSTQNRAKNVVLIDSRQDDGDFAINTLRGDIIICDWYLLTAVK